MTPPSAIIAGTPRGSDIELLGGWRNVSLPGLILSLARALALLALQLSVPFFSRHVSLEWDYNGKVGVGVSAAGGARRGVGWVGVSTERAKICALCHVKSARRT